MFILFYPLGIHDICYNQIMFLIERTRNWYGRFERPISSLSLVLGFVFDIVTLKRVDTFWENSWIFAHIVIVGLFIMLIHRHDNQIGDEEDPHKIHFWYVNILQFFFGGLLSTYLVFYFRSADIFVTWPFILILAIAFIANESLKRHYVRLSFQISLFFLSVYSFAIFLVPVILHKIGTWVFIISGIISLIFIFFYIYILFYFIKDKFIQSKKIIIFVVAGIFALVNFLYFTNLIPPIPLSLKDAGVYYSIQKNQDGDYNVTYEDYDWKEYFQLYKDFKKVPGIPVYAYSAIFSPKDLNINIIHEWQHYDDVQKKWIIESVINLPVRGGRDGGFRTYSMLSELAPGKWRVNIETEIGQTIGRIRFNVISNESLPLIKTDIKD